MSPAICVTRTADRCRCRHCYMLTAIAVATRDAIDSCCHRHACCDAAVADTLRLSRHAYFEIRRFSFAAVYASPSAFATLPPMPLLARYPLRRCLPLAVCLRHRHAAPPLRALYAVYAAPLYYYAVTFRLRHSGITATISLFHREIVLCCRVLRLIILLPAAFLRCLRRAAAISLFALIRALRCRAHARPRCRHAHAMSPRRRPPLMMPRTATLRRCCFC